jgi:hypothetical protein
MLKSLWQAGFSEIKIAAKANNKIAKKNKGAKCTMNIFYRIMIKSAF